MGTDSKKSGNTGKKSTFLGKVLFFVFLLFFSAASMSMLVFYGPFQTVKRTLVGASWYTLSHQYIARFFLTDEAIARILGSTYAIDPTLKGEEVQTLTFGKNHDDRIEVFNIDGGDFRGKMIIVHNPLTVVAGYSENMPKSGETTSSIALRNGAAAAINAGGFIDQGWTGTGGAPMGFIIHDGKVVYNQYKSESIKMDTAAFTNTGMLIVGKHSISQLKKYGVKEGVSFGPPLIVNGRPTISKGDGGYGIAPRTAIGQKKTGEVIFLVIDGRSLESLGASLKEVQDILLQYGAVNAVNLDGGSSTTMYFNGKVINKPSDKLGERTVPTVFMSVPNRGGTK